MSAQPCGCDDGVLWKCRAYPNCAWGRAQNLGPIEAPLVYTEPASMPTPAAPPVLAPGPTPMTLSEFHQSIDRTYKPNHIASHALGIACEAGEVLELIIGATGCIYIGNLTDGQKAQVKTAFTAAGRVADIIKKALFHEEPRSLLDHPYRNDMRKELGDVLWYVAAVASDWGFTLEEVARENVRKLAERYPQGFVEGGGVRESGPEAPEIPAVLCAHANKCPRVCPCPPNCYCRRAGSAPCCRQQVRQQETALSFDDSCVQHWCVRPGGHTGPHRNREGGFF